VIDDHLHARLAQGVDDAVLAGGSHVVVPRAE
jgi:hypothetical protein